MNDDIFGIRWIDFNVIAATIGVQYFSIRSA